MVPAMDRQITLGRSERPPTVRDPYDRRDDPKTRLNLIRLRTHRLIARKIDADPSLLEIPRRNLDRWRELRGEDCPASAEWRELLKQPWEKIRALIVADTEDSTRLRLSTPFVGILTPEEREQFHGPVDEVYKRRAERVTREIQEDIRKKASARAKPRGQVR